MYNVKFINEVRLNSDFSFGAENNVSDVDIAQGMSVNLVTSQGFNNVGERIESMSVKGRTITIKGCIYGNALNIVATKDKLQKSCAPFTKGKLVYGDEYEIDVIVKDSPTFAEEKTDGRFMLSFYAPHPYYRDTITHLIPANSENPVNNKEIIVDSVVPVPYKIEWSAFGTSSSNLYIKIVNELTQQEQELKFNGVIRGTDVIRIEQDESRVLTATLVRNSVEYDVTNRLTATATTLPVGASLFTITDDEGFDFGSVLISYHDEWVNIYEH